MTNDAKTFEQATIIDVEPQVIEDVAPVKKRKSFLPRLLLGGALGLACALAGGWTYRDFLAQYFPNDQTASLLTRIEGLETAQKDSQTRIAAVIALTEELKSQLGAAQASAAQNNKLAEESTQVSQKIASDFTTLQQELVQAQTQIAAVKADLGALATGTSDAGLFARIEALEKGQSAAALNKTDSQIVVVPTPQKLDPAFGKAELQKKLARGEDISAQWELLAVLPEEMAGLSIILAAKDKNIANVPALMAEFAAIDFSGQSAHVPQQEAGWSDYITSWFSGLVTITDAGEPATSVAIKKAQALVASGDYAQAFAVLNEQGLDLPPALKEWTNRAAERLQLDKAFADLTATLKAQQ